jgi:hypothetical protein
MRKLDRVLGLRGVRSKAVPDLGGKSDNNASLGGSGSGDARVSGSAKVLPRLDLSQVWKPTRNQQQQTVRYPEPCFFLLSFDFTAASAHHRRDYIGPPATDSKVSIAHPCGLF